MEDQHVITPRKLCGIAHDPQYELRRLEHDAARLFASDTLKLLVRSLERYWSCKPKHHRHANSLYAYCRSSKLAEINDTNSLEDYLGVETCFASKRFY